jgi:hypothetical protein
MRLRLAVGVLLCGLGLGDVERDKEESPGENEK